MKFISIFVAVLFFAACSKEDVYGPWNLKNGQEVELQVSHRYAAIDDEMLLLPQNEPAQMPLYSFTEREPGYTYRVKARMVAEKTPPQDGPAYHLEFIEIISREKYTGNEPFKIALIKSYVPGGPVISLMKQDGLYHYSPGKLTLSYANDEIQAQLEEIWENAEYIRQNWQTPGIQSAIKWKTITATVTHDPGNFGKAYLVEHIEFTE